MRSTSTTGFLDLVDLKTLRRVFMQYPDIAELYPKIFNIMVILDDIRAGPINLRDIINSSRPSNFKEFETFLQVLEIYGAGYDLDEGPEKTSRFKITEDQISHEDIAIEILNELKIALEFAYNSLNTPTKRSSLEHFHFF